MAVKLAGGSYYGASLLWVPMFGSCQPCGWPMGKLMPKMTSNRNSSLNFAEIAPNLLTLLDIPNQCVIRWFSFVSVNAYHGIQVVFLANRH